MQHQTSHEHRNEDSLCVCKVLEVVVSPPQHVGKAPHPLSAGPFHSLYDQSPTHPKTGLHILGAWSNERLDGMAGTSRRAWQMEVMEMKSSEICKKQKWRHVVSDRRPKVDFVKVLLLWIFCSRHHSSPSIILDL